MKPSRSWIMALTAFLLAGCAAVPRYQSVKRYLPPEQPEARACIETCGHQRERCQNECAKRYAACREAVLPEARERYAQRLKDYERELTDYRWALERYRMDLLFGWGHWHPYWGWWGMAPPFPPPPPPRAPTLEEEIARLGAERCDRDCGCETAFDACFTACGGEIRHERQCVAHCGGA